MSDDASSRVKFPSKFNYALERLQRMLSEALWRVKIDSSGAAWSDIKHAKSAKKKIDILNQNAHQWMEDSAQVIRHWLPQFVDLALAYPKCIVGDALHWTKDRVWLSVEGQCGLQRPKAGELRRHDLINRVTIYWFAVAAEGNVAVNRPPIRPWNAPRWLASDKRRAEDLLRDHTSRLSLRLANAIDEQLDFVEIQATLKRRAVDADFVPPVPRDPKLSASETKRRVTELAIADAGPWRSFRFNFKALADEELTLDPGNRHDRWLRAHVEYTHQAPDCGTWHVSSGPTEDFRVSFELFATRAGVALRPRPDTKPLDFWLHSLFLDLLKHDSQQLFAAQEGRGGIIVRVCEASATYCARLERAAVEKSASESCRKTRLAEVSPAEKLADASKYPTLTVQEATEVLRLSRASIYHCLSEGRLDRPGLNKKPGKKSKTLVLTTSVQKMLRPQEE